MGIHLEPVTAVLRMGDDFHGFGDPYEFSATVIIRGNRAEMVGGAGRFRPKWRRDIRAALLLWNVTEVVFERKYPRRREVTLSPPVVKLNQFRRAGTLQQRSAGS